MNEHRIFYVDISNLLNRWFFLTDANNFMDFLRKSIKTKKCTLEIVREWNEKYAKHPSQYVFYNEQG